MWNHNIYNKEGKNKMEICVFIFGIVIGSFLNVCIYRIPIKESIVYGSSHCTKCGNKIKWYDLIPVFSYLILMGKCRYCKEKISLQYPCIELINGVAYLGLYLWLGLTVWFGLACLVFSVLLVLFMIRINNR